VSSLPGASHEEEEPRPEEPELQQETARWLPIARQILLLLAGAALIVYALVGHSYVLVITGIILIAGAPLEVLMTWGRKNTR
jgi:hypothetical protein